MAIRTIREQLQTAIKLQQAEVDRIQTVVKTDLVAAKARLDVLKQLLADVTPAYEALADRIDAANID